MHPSQASRNTTHHPTPAYDADSGRAACGDLTDAELGRAVDEVLDELMASKAAQ